jgi:hypothetical protein
MVKVEQKEKVEEWKTRVKNSEKAERYASNKRSGAYDLETSFRRIQDYQETAIPEVLAGQVLGTWMEIPRPCGGRNP